MQKKVLASLVSAMIGSLLEEGVEEVFPGVGELGPIGEVMGMITGIIGSSSNEIKQSTELFVRYAYKYINKKSMPDNLTDSEIELFEKHFKDLPSNIRKEIIDNFKNLSPYEYGVIKDMLKNMERSY